VRVIVEGCDGVGKSTLIYKLSKFFNEMPVGKGSSFEQSTTNNETLFKGFMDKANARHIIWDRYIHSNLVYADLYDDFAIINREQTKQIEDKIRYNSKVIYLHGSPELIKQRLLERGDEYVDQEKVEAILEKYETVIDNSSLDVFKIDVTGKDEEQVFNEVLKKVFNYERNHKQN